MAKHVINYNVQNVITWNNNLHWNYNCSLDVSFFVKRLYGFCSTVYFKARNASKCGKGKASIGMETASSSSSHSSISLKEQLSNSDLEEMAILPLPTQSSYFICIRSQLNMTSQAMIIPNWRICLLLVHNNLKGFAIGGPSKFCNPSWLSGYTIMVNLFSRGSNHLRSLEVNRMLYVTNDVRIPARTG